MYECVCSICICVVLAFGRSLIQGFCQMCHKKFQKPGKRKVLFCIGCILLQIGRCKWYEISINVFMFRWFQWIIPVAYFKGFKMLFSNFRFVFFIITLITRNNAKLSLLHIVTSYYKRTSFCLEVCVFVFPLCRVTQLRMSHLCCEQCTAELPTRSPVPFT